MPELDTEGRNAVKESPTDGLPGYEPADASPVVLGIARKSGAQEGRREVPPCSATRFVLPFELPVSPSGEGRAGRGPECAPKIHYREAAKDDWIWENQKGRRKYLTVETRHALFERAQWWVMETAAETPITMSAPDGVKVKGIVRPPVVLLFDAVAENRFLRRGFLVVEVALEDHPRCWRLDDLLLFNELFRYWREPWQGHEAEYEPQLQGFIEPFKSLTGQAVSGPYEDRWLALLKVPMKDGSTFPDGSALNAQDVFGAYADERAFVWTRALMKGDLKLIIPRVVVKTSEGSKWKATTDSQTGRREMFGYWVKLLNVDKPALETESEVPPGYKQWKTTTNETTAFEREWAGQHTYRRWEHVDCYYGFTHFSAAMLSGPCDNPPTWQHWFQMYFDQALLLLYMRVTLFRFSRELSDVSNQMLTRPKPGENPAAAVDQWRGDFRELRRAFTGFENLYQFPLFSNQQQAVEMYVKAREGLDIDGLYKEVAGEIRSSDELLESEVGEKRNELAEKLTKVAFLGLLYTITLSGVGAVFAVFDAFWPGDLNPKTLFWPVIFATGIFILTALFGANLWYRATRTKTDSKEVRLKKTDSRRKGNP